MSYIPVTERSDPDGSSGLRPNPPLISSAQGDAIQRHEQQLTTMAQGLQEVSSNPKWLWLVPVDGISQSLGNSGVGEAIRSLVLQFSVELRKVFDHSTTGCDAVQGLLKPLQEGR
ncbi:hypothetical protein LDENG_00024010 [Lucifuga dentata]|nr:hypothetical protein LDENG_00024010 [Lucifuga dentata]